MEIIDKIIFNKLLARESIFLPGIGALILKQEDAKIVDNNRLSPPQWRVRFSSQHDNIISILEVISLKINISAEEVLPIYKRWLISVSRDGKYIINGVGVVDKAFFTLDKSLSVLINPLEGREIAIVKKRDNSLRPIGIVAVVTLFILLGYFVFDKLNDRGEDLEIKTIAWRGKGEVVDEIGVATVGSGSESIKDSTKKEADKSLDKGASSSASVVSANISTQETPSIQQDSTTTTYHLVVGIFSTLENAETFISDLKGTNSSLSPSTTSFKGGKILVSLHSSGDYELVEGSRKDLSALFPEIWIYKATE